MKSSIRTFEVPAGVPPERSYYRDEGIYELHERHGIVGIVSYQDWLMSGHHRVLGPGISGTDIDFFVETAGKIVAIIEYKQRRPRENEFNTSNYRALINLSLRARLPLFIVFYNQDRTEFCVVPLGRIAEEIWAPRILTEAGYAEFVHSLSGFKTGKGFFTVTREDAEGTGFLLLEHKYGEIVALIEYKQRRHSENEFETANDRALINLSLRARLPFFTVFYNQKRTKFYVMPRGQIAEEIWTPRTLSRTEYADFSYEIRGLGEAPEEVKRNLITLPW